MNTSLCDLPPEVQSGCDQPPPPAAPLRPFNPPGQRQLAYRVGTFTSFRRAMLTALIERVPRWREGAGRDYATMLVELWAYIADVLTFYQERIANEAYLPTATQRDSLARLAELIDYRPAPGAAATALLAFKVAPGKSVEIPARLRVGSRASPGQPAATFETDAAIAALGENSAIRLARLGPSNQFGPLGVGLQPQPGLGDELEELARRVSKLEIETGARDVSATLAEAAKLAMEGELGLQQAREARQKLQVILAQVLGQAGERRGEKSFVELAVFLKEAIGLLESPPGSSGYTRSLVFKGTVTRLRPGDHLLIFDVNPELTIAGQLREVAEVQPDRAAGVTRVKIFEDPTYAYKAWGPQIFAMRTRTAVFGASAPLWASLSPYLTQKSVAGYPNTPAYPDDWDSPASPAYFVGAEKELFLDRTYEGTAASSVSAPSWCVVMAGADYSIFRIKTSDQAGHSDFSLTARVTRLELDGQIPAATYSVRSTSVLVHSELIELQDLLPLDESVNGNTLLLDGSYEHLPAGRQVIVSGPLLSTGELTAEDAVVQSVGAPAGGLTTITLKAQLKNIYRRSATVLLANVAPASHGETVAVEVLGGGDGSAWQTFGLRKSPLTYLPDLTTGSETAVASTLQVTVDGVLWQERRSLLEAGAGDRVYMVAEDSSQHTYVAFGDGVNGARPSTGRDNIRARYRRGLGTTGDRPAGSIQQLVDSLPGLQGVNNPEPSLSGANPESADQLRVNVPASLRTFGRAVSPDDYTAIALTYPGVTRATAAWIRRDPAGGAQPVMRLVVELSGGLPLTRDFRSRMRQFLDLRRDPNVPLRIEDFTPAPIELALTVDVEDGHGRNRTLGLVLAALNPARNPDGTVGLFGRLSFGESVHLSAVYAAVQRVAGVRNAVVSLLRAVGGMRPVEDDIVIGATELATVDPRTALKVELGSGGLEN